MRIECLVGAMLAGTPLPKFGQMGDLTVQEESIEDLKDKQHCHASSDCSSVCRRYEFSDDGGFASQRYHTAPNAECHVLLPWEAVDEEDSHGIESESKSQPRTGVNNLFNRAVAKCLVQRRTIICGSSVLTVEESRSRRLTIDDEDARALNYSGGANGEKHSLSVRRLLEHMDPGVA